MTGRLLREVLSDSDDPADTLADLVFGGQWFPPDPRDDGDDGEQGNR